MARQVIEKIRLFSRHFFLDFGRGWRYTVIKMMKKGLTMNQAEKQFLTEFQDLCHKYGVTFATDLCGIGFSSDFHDIHVDVQDLEDLEAQVAKS